MRAGYAVVCLASTLPAVIASGPYKFTDSYKGHDFYDAWKWDTFDDPTHGRVNYVDQATGIRDNLTFATSDKFIMRVDTQKVVPQNARGRDSIRIVSDKAYDETVIVIDLQHMPHGCGTWPAFWSLSKAGPWPQGGEIDIIEGVHMQTSNLATLHTTSNCEMESTRPQNGKTVTTNCDAGTNFNIGCGTEFTKPNSYGAGFNSVGGGYYAMRKGADFGVSVWFWPRGDCNLPPGIADGSASIDPSTFGQPEAHFPIDKCEHKSHFNAHMMVFDTTFCGDWGRAAWGTSGCAATSCEDFVNQNPSAFAEAYWEVNSIRVYTLDTSPVPGLDLNLGISVPL